MALKGSLVGNDFWYFITYVRLFNVMLHKVERYARVQAASVEAATEAIDVSREVTVSFKYSG